MKRMNLANRSSKFVCLFLCLILTAALFAGCASNNGTSASEHTTSETITDATEPPTSTAEPSTDTEKNTGSHILVVYFSATGHTAPIAEYAAEILGADLYEIKAKQPYTEADLAYYTDGRCDREQADPSVRPEIDGAVDNMDQYDTILIGHPIWHRQAPRIISTFLESYDFSNKTLVTFCTSSSSGLGSSASNLYGLVPSSAKWLESRRFAVGSSKEEVAAWLSEIGLEKNTETNEMKIQITVGDRTMSATLSDNASAKAFYELLKKGPVSIDMHDYGSFEKVGPLGTDIVRSDENITTTPGDIILYQGNQVTVYYDVNTWSFTLLGHIDGATGENMRAFLGDGDVTVTFSAE